MLYAGKQAIHSSIINLMRFFPLASNPRIFVLLLALIFSASPGSTAAKKGKPAPAPVIVEGQWISVNAKGHKLSAILKEISEKTGIKIDAPKGFGDRPVNMKFRRLDYREAIRKLLGRDYLFLLEPKGKGGLYKLKKVIVGAGRWRPESLKPGGVAAWDFVYGSKSGEIGVDQKKNLGPRAYTVGPDRRILVSDAINNRVKIFSVSGRYLSSIKTGEGVRPEDIALDSKGSIYLYDGKNRKIIQYGSKGRPATEVKVDEKRWRSRGRMKVVGNGLYIHGCTFSVCGDMILGNIEHGLLRPPDKKQLEGSTPSGELGSGGRRYETDVRMYESGSLKIFKSSGKLLKNIDLPVKGIETLGFLGEDEAGHFYVKLEWSGKRSLHAEVHEFDRDGKPVRKVMLPDAGVANWPSVRTAVDPAGTIFDLVAGDEFATLYIIP